MTTFTSRVSLWGLLCLFIGALLILPRSERSKEQVYVKPSKMARIDQAMQEEFLKTVDLSTRTVPRERLKAARDYVKSLNPNALPLPLTWEERGPDNVGGRTRAILIDNANDPTNNTVFAAGVAGGIWKTTNFKDDNPTWNAINDFFENIAVTAITQDPTDSNVMYFGTGEGWFFNDAGSFSAVRGLGIWKSTDGGTTWSQLPATDNPDFFFIQDVMVDATGNLYAATGDAGLQKSTDGGTSFTEVLSTAEGGGTADFAADIEIGADGDVYVSLARVFDVGSIFKSDFQTNGANTGDAGTWTNISPAGDFERIELGVAPSDANVIYATCQGAGTFDVTAIFRSDDQGGSWNSLPVPTIIDQGNNSVYTRGQGWYDQITVVDPNVASTVYIGGIDALRSVDSGNTWEQITTWSLFMAPDFGPAQNVHADHHMIVFEPGSSTNAIWGTDGGLDYTTDVNNTNGKPSWVSKNSGYNVTQFYAGAISNEPASNNILGGTQDNGTPFFSMMDMGVNSSVDVTGGDGGFSHIDETNAQVQIGSNQNANYWITNNQWASRTFRSVGQPRFINPTDYDSDSKIFYCVSLGAGGEFAFIENIGTTNNTGIRSVPALAGLSSSSIYVSPNVANRIYIGTTQSRIFRIDDANTNSPTATEITGNLPSGPFNTCIVAEEGNENHMLVTFSNYGVTSVWETINGGTSWTAVEGNLPDMPVRWAVFNPRNPDQALLATEMGVWSTDDLDGGSTDWGPSNLGLANTRVDMLQISPADNRVLAATHGRGFFTTDGLAAPPCLVEITGVDATDPTTCGGQDGTVTINATGATNLEYSFDGGTTWGASNTMNFPAGTIMAGQLRVRDADEPGCSAIWDEQITLNDPDAPTFELEGTNPNDCTQAEGMITITGLPADTEFEVSIDNGATFNDFTSDADGRIEIGSLMAGTYFVVLRKDNCTSAAKIITLVAEESGFLFTVTGQFDDFTPVIVDNEFAANDEFVLPAGDCHSDPSFSIEVVGATCGDTELFVAADNATTGSFLAVTGPDAFGDYVFEMDDVIPGTYSIVVTVTDGESITEQAAFEVTIVDETAPTIDIPGGTLSLLAPSVCESNRLQVWSLQADDDCTGEVPVEVISVTEEFFYNGPAPFAYDDDFSGDNYGLLFLLLDANPFQIDPSLTGLFYTITVRATDIYGNAEIKTWFVEVVAPSVRGINSLACNDTVNVTVNNYCYAPLTPDAVLEGLPNACEDRYYVKVAYPYEGHTVNEVTKCGVFKYTVYEGDPAVADTENDKFICWGYVNAEDKTPPTGCINKVVGLAKTPGSSTPIKQHDVVVDTEIDADYFGAKEGKDDAFKKINGVFYKYQPVTNEDPASCPNDGIDVKYAPNDASINLLICTDVDSILNVSASYLDDDYAYYTGTPYVVDNCQQPGWLPKLVKVNDELLDYQCNYGGRVDMVGGRLVSQKIIRTFVYEDEKGNKVEIPQEICFFKPLIQLPECKEYFDVCWYGTDNDLLPEDINSFPTYTNAVCMTMPLLDHVCNVTVTYEDLTLPGPYKCGDKIIRTWTILDWCWNPVRYDGINLVRPASDDCDKPGITDWKSKLLTYEQHLIIGEKEPPLVYCPEKDEDWYNGSDVPVFSTGAFACEAGFEVPAPIVKKFNDKTGRNEDACAYTWTVEVYTDVDELWHGVPTGNKVRELNSHVYVGTDIDEVTWTTNSVTVAKVPKGAHYFRYIVQDQCGKIGYSDYCPFYVIDEIAPAAICNDDLNISIGGDQNSRVYAKDIDEGSYDNCSEIELKTRRFIPEDCLEAFVANTELTLCDIYIATNGRCSNTNSITLNKPASVYDGAKGYYTPWLDYVDVTCCDVKSEVLIELRATDNANMSRDKKGEPIFGDNVKPFPGYKVNQKDNINICWLEVYVEDKLPPICQAPKDVEIDCEDIPYNLPEVSKHTSEGKDGIVWGPEEIADPANALIVEWLNGFDDPAGRPAAIDNCDADVDMIKVKFVVHCKAGYIERTFQATDAWGLKSSNTCVQRIWIARHHDYCIKFPKDAEAECKNMPDVPTVEFFEYGCDLLAVSIQDERFNSDIKKGDDSECYKIFRTYRVLNWCQFDEDIDPDRPLFDRFDTEYDIDPLVIGRDEDCDEWPGDEDVYVRFKGKENKNGYLEGTTWIDSDCEPWNDSPKSNKHKCNNPWGHWEELNYTGGFYQYTQVIKVFDDVPPAVTSVGEDKFPTYASPGKGDDKAVVCVGQVDRMFEVVEECTPDHILVDRVILKPDAALGLGPITLVDNGAITSDGASFGLSISDFTLGSDSTAQKATISGQFPIGSHVFEVRVADGCGSKGGVDLPFEVFDDKAPAPICKALIGVQLMPVDEDNDGQRDEGAGMAVVWAQDFIASEIWDCSEPITYSIARAAEIEAGAEPDPDQTNITVDCSDSEVVVVYVYAWDAAGNRDRCEAQLLVNDLSEFCSPFVEGGVIVSGLVYTEEDYAVPGVEVQVAGASSNAMMTENDGLYEFNIEPGQDYTITPYNNLDHKNGVSTADLILASKHILGVERLASPYKMIAADVNNSGSVTTLDLIQMRKVILSIDKQFKNNTSWRFIDASYNFPDANNPWTNAFPEVINLNDIEPEDLINGDFIAVKVGDLNASAAVADFIEEREFVGDFTMSVQDQALTTGNEYSVSVNADDLTSIEGYQFTLNYSNEIEVIGIDEGLAKADNFGFIQDGIITTSWNQVAGSKAKNNESTLFTLNIKANADIQLSEVLSIGSQFTVAEAYNNQGQLLDTKIDFKGSSNVASFKLYQNEPNPFQAQTNISFLMPEAGKVTLSIHDVRGKMLQVIEGQYPAGKNMVQVNGQELPTGVLYYTLSSGEFTATKKMIVLQ